MFIFFKNVGIIDSNEVEILAILKAIRIFLSYFIRNLRMESKFSSNAFSWVSSSYQSLWKFHFHSARLSFNLLLSRLVLTMGFFFANCVAGFRAKQGLRVVPLSAHIFVIYWWFGMLLLYLGFFFFSAELSCGCTLFPTNMISLSLPIRKNVLGPGSERSSLDEIYDGKYCC